MSSGTGDKGAEPQNKTERQESVPRKEIEFVPAGERPPKGKARYRDPANPFNSWSGRGKRPTWLKTYLEEGKTLSQFEVHENEE